MKVKEGMYMRRILEAIKNFFSASHERERKGIQATKHGMFNNFVYAVKADMAVKQSVYYSNDCSGSIVGIVYAYWNLYSKDCIGISRK